MTTTADTSGRGAVADGDAGPRPLSKSHRNFVSYIDKSREFYRAHGYEKPYLWATSDESPFTGLDKPLSQSRVAVVTTTFLRQDDRPAGSPPPLPKRVYAHPSDQVPDGMFTDDLSWHKTATHTDDVESFLPMTRLREFAEQGVIGSVAPRFFGVPTEYSQRKTRADAEQIAEWCREDEVDAVILVPL